MLLLNLLKNSSFPGQLNLKHTKKVIFTASTDSIHFNHMKKYLPTGTIRSSVFFLTYYGLMKFSVRSVFKCNLNLRPLRLTIGNKE